MTKKKTIIILGGILLVLGLAACGNKGDLYLPEEKSNKTEQNNPQNK